MDTTFGQDEKLNKLGLLMTLTRFNLSAKSKLHNECQKALIRIISYEWMQRIFSLAPKFVILQGNIVQFETITVTRKSKNAVLKHEKAWHARIHWGTGGPDPLDFPWYEF